MESVKCNKTRRRKFLDSPRLKKITKDFVSNGGKFRKCKAQNYFLVRGNPQLNKGSFVFDNTNEYPYFTRTVLNNGILGYVDYLDVEHKIKGNSIAVGMLGMQFFYMEKDFYAGQFTKTIFPKFEGLNETNAQYFISWFNKSSLYYASKLVRDFETLFNETTLILPFKDNLLSLAFMEQYIRELEFARIRELEIFLKVCGFTDCNLTQEELSAIEKFRMGGVKYKEYQIDTLLEKVNCKKLKYKVGDLPQQATGSYNLPCLTSGTSNQGLSCFVPRENTNILKNVISIASNGSAGTTYYQDSEFTILQDAYAIKSKNKELSREQYLFLVTTISKLTLKKFSWSDKAGWNKVAKEKFYLPVNENGEIDFDFMQTYIRAIQKQVIKHVIDWKDKEIAETKKICK